MKSQDSNCKPSPATSCSGVWLAAWLVILLPLSIACLLVGELILDEAHYIRLLQCNLFTVYAGAFLAALLQCKKNPSGKERG